MTAETVEGLPEWAQLLAYGLFAVGLAVMALWNHRRKAGSDAGGAEEDAGGAGSASETKLVAGAIFSTKHMLELTNALEKNTDQVRESERGVCDCANELIDELRKHRRAIEDQRRN